MVVKLFYLSVLLGGAAYLPTNVFALSVSNDFSDAQTQPVDDKGLFQWPESARLEKYLAHTRDPEVYSKYQNFVDSEYNQRQDYLIGSSIQLYKAGYGLHFEQITAKDKVGQLQTERVWGSLDYTPSKAWNLQALAGTVEGQQGVVSKGTLNMSSPTWKGSLYISNDLLSDTAILVRNTIHVFEKRVTANFMLSDMLSLDMRGRTREYSDDNSSKNLQLAPWYTVKRQFPRINIGYRYEQQQFKTQTESGYFDPKDLQSRQVLVAISHRGQYFTGSMELGYGAQAFNYNNSNTKNTTFSYYLEGRYDVSSGLALVCSGEGGDYALSSSGGYKYNTYNVNVRRYF